MKQPQFTETLFRTLIEISNDAIALVRPDGVVAYVNSAYEKLIGYTSDEVVNTHFIPYFQPDSAPRVVAFFEQMMTHPNGTAVFENLHLRTKNGDTRIIEGTSRVLPDGTLVSFCRDVTDRYQAEQALRDLNAELERRVAERTAELEKTLMEQRRLAAIVEATPDYVGIADLNGWSLYVNEAGKQMVGKQDDDYGGRWNVANCYPAHQVPVLQEMIETALHGEIWRGETALLRQDGTEMPVYEVTFALRGTDGEIESLGTFIRDITADKRASAELQAAKDAAEAALAESRRLIEVIELSPDLIGMSDLQGNMFYMNRLGRARLGLEENSALNVNFVQYYTPESAALVGETAIPTVLDKGYWQGEVMMVDPRDDSQFPASIVAILHRAPDGTPLYLSGVSRDISDLKRYETELRTAKDAAEAALAESRRLTTILEASPDIVGMADAQGKMTYLNQAARHKLGLEDNDLNDFRMVDLYTPDSQQILQTVGIPTAMEQGSWTGEVTIQSSKGDQQFPVSLVGLVHRAPDGTPEFLSGVARDISDRIRSEQELQQAKDAAEAANRAKSTFLANMSHEIRTPMNAIIGMTSLLLDTPLEAKQRDFVEIIRASGDSLLTIINDILDFSKIEADKLELVHRPFDLRECVESALDLFAPRAAEKHLDLAYIIEDHVPDAIVHDGTRLRQILVNLIGNAIKFTEHGEVVVTLSSVPADDQRAELHIAVRDTGLGIPADKMDRLFKSFSQVDASMTREYGGTGLGLAISKRLSELMGGMMWAESDGVAGRGSTFHFTILAPVADAPKRPHLNTLQPELRGKRILIVDDNPTNRRILTLQTQTWGMTAHEAATPGEALAILRTGAQYDAAILDMLMPEMNGNVLAVEIHKIAGMVALPLVMLTSLGGQSNAGRDISACLTKPVKPSELFDTLVSLFVGAASAPTIPAPVRETPDQPLAQRIPLRILLAEDVVVNQKFAVHALERMGYRVDVVANGLEAVQAVMRQNYNVILMDVQMPEMDGLEATRQIRKMRLSQPHIIAMTANAMQGDRETCLNAGMDDYISKPVYIQELHAALERAGARLYRTQPEPISFEDELAAAFREEAGVIFDALRTAVQNGDSTAVRSAAHKLKGSSAYLNAHEVSRIAAELERHSKSGDLSVAPTLVEALERELSAVFEHIPMQG